MKAESGEGEIGMAVSSGGRQLNSNDPLFFDSFYRPQVWGGRGLNHLLGRPLAGDGPYGEAWELSSHSLHVSTVVDGPNAGHSLSDLWASHRAELAGDCRFESFPLLLKWLECRELLSLQVHPNDSMARRILNEPFGKSEAWVVIAADPSAVVYAGLKPGVTRNDVVQSIQIGTLIDCLHSFTPTVGDCISLPAGTIHAAGGGVMFAEVQQTSDATFRLHDWNRMGLDGKPRALQVERGLDAVDWNQGPINPVVPKEIKIGLAGVRAESLVTNLPFSLERYVIEGGMQAPHSGEMTIWMVLGGTAELKSPESGFLRRLVQGETTLFPSTAKPLVWQSTDESNPLTLLCARLITL